MENRIASPDGTDWQISSRSLLVADSNSLRGINKFVCCVTLQFDGRRWMVEWRMFIDWDQRNTHHMSMSSSHELCNHHVTHCTQGQTHFLPISYPPTPPPCRESQCFIMDYCYCWLQFIQADIRSFYSKHLYPVTNYVVFSALHILFPRRAFYNFQSGWTSGPWSLVSSSATQLSPGSLHWPSGILGTWTAKCVCNATQ